MIEVIPASTQDRDCAAELFEKALKMYPRLRKIFADGGYAGPKLPMRTLTGGLSSYGACQAEARRLRDAGAARLEAPAAALKPGTARGWTAAPDLVPALEPRDGKVWVVFGPCEAVGWPAVVAGAPPQEVLPLVRAL